MMESADSSVPTTSLHEWDPTPARPLYLVLRVGKRRYAMESTAVREVLRGRAMATLPAAGRSVSGTIFLRGTCITVLDLGWILTGGAMATSRRSRIVVLRKPQWAALLVDGVIALARDCTRQSLDPNRPAGRDAPFVAGSVDWGQETLAVLDVESILESERPSRAAQGTFQAGVHSKAARTGNADKETI